MCERFQNPLGRLQGVVKLWDRGELFLAASTAAAPEPASGSSAAQAAAAPAVKNQGRGSNGGLFVHWKSENWARIKAEAAEQAGDQKRPDAAAMNKLAGEIWQALPAEEKEAATMRWKGDCTQVAACWLLPIELISAGGLLAQLCVQRLEVHHSTG